MSLLPKMGTIAGLSLAGLTRIYVLTPYDLDSFPLDEAGRVVVSRSSGS